jgi:hypothetical protein
MFQPLIVQMETIVEISGTDYSQYGAKAKNIVAATMSTAGAIKKVLDTPILTESGEITDNSLTAAEEIKGFLAATQSA